MLRQHPQVFRGRIGTYDVRQSGLGYLFATQDTRASEIYWRLTEVMGGLFMDHLLRRSHGTTVRALSNPALGLSQVEPALNRIKIGPGLLVFLDQLKKRSFLTEWESAILQN